MGWFGSNNKDTPEVKTRAPREMRTELYDGEEVVIEKHDKGRFPDCTVGSTFLFNDGSGGEYHASQDTITITDKDIDGYGDTSGSGGDGDTTVVADAHQYLLEHYKQFSFFGGSLYVTNQRIIFEVNEEFSDIFADSLTESNQIISFDNISSTTWRKDSLSVLEINGPETKFSLKEDIQEIQEQIEAIFWNLMRQKAKQCEENLDYKQAIKLWENIGEPDQAKRIRKRMQDEGKVKVDQTVIHGDYVDDRDTIVKDSVINRSNIGAGGKSKAEEIKEIKELLDSDAIDDDEFKQMKKEILGK